jgi:hypothetical protein
VLCRAEQVLCKPPAQADWQRRLAALFVLVALAGCASMAAGPGQAPNAPYQQGDPRDTSGMHCPESWTASPGSNPGPAVRLALEPRRTSPAERVQFVPASKPATGTALDISLPSIRNTRPLDADSRVFNAS